MVLNPPACGEIFRKTGTHSIIWRVERLNLDLRIAHVVLAKVGDPKTMITISGNALSNPRYFCCVGRVS